MARFPRNFLETLYFHVMVQGINKEYIFENSEDIKYYISLMYKLCVEHEIKIVAYCVMNNHAHILVRTKEVKELSKYMQRLNTRYGMYYNKKNNRVGYVFRDRYKSEGIYSNNHLYNCISYIYNNPVKAGICKNAEDYPYSNYKKVDGIFDRKYVFIDTEEDMQLKRKDIINEFLTENNLDLNKLKNDKISMKKLAILLKEDYGISLRQIADEIGISRETLRRIYNK